MTTKPTKVRSVLTPPVKLMPSKKSVELNQAIVRELFDYDPETGDLTWRLRARRWFNSDRAWRRWNTLFAGKLVRTTTGDCLQTCIFGHKYRVHRLIWLHVTGAWPNAEIDHLNRRWWDNRLINLRQATRQENSHNQSLYRNNKSGRVGVFWLSDRGKWRAEICVSGRDHILGSFATFEEAVAARAAAEREHGYSPNHGGRRQYKRVTLRRRPDQAPSSASP